MDMFFLTSTVARRPTGATGTALLVTAWQARATALLGERAVPPRAGTWEGWLARYCYHPSPRYRGIRGGMQAGRSRLERVHPTPHKGGCRIINYHTKQLCYGQCLGGHWVGVFRPGREHEEGWLARYCRHPSNRSQSQGGGCRLDAFA
jgi:hypothetical protein